MYNLYKLQPKVHSSAQIAFSSLSIPQDMVNKTLLKAHHWISLKIYSVVKMCWNMCYNPTQKST